MGLISWIKDTYYNHKLDNADSAYHSNDISEAERIYLEILDKNPDAAEHLAKMYYEVALSRKDELLYLSSLKSLLSKASLGKEKVSMYKVRLVSDIENFHTVPLASVHSAADILILTQHISNVISNCFVFIVVLVL